VLIGGDNHVHSAEFFVDLQVDEYLLFLRIEKELTVHDVQDEIAKNGNHEERL
jgi:hypothetical protein